MNDSKKLEGISTEEFGVTLNLIGRAKTGDENALNELFDRYSGRVLEIVRIRLGQSLRRSLESMDIVQETLGQAFESFNQYEIRDDAGFVDWLAKIAENRIARRADYIRALKRDPDRVVPIDSPKKGDSGETVRHEIPSPQGSLSTDLIQEEERQIVTDCIAELPRHYRNVIALRDYLGLSWEDVAEKGGHSSAGAARMVHNRARIALGKRLRTQGLD